MNIKLIDFTCAAVGCIISALLIYGDISHVGAAAIILSFGTVLAAGIRIFGENND